MTPTLYTRLKVDEDLREKGWRREEALDRRVWRGRIKEGNAEPKMRLGKGAVKKKEKKK
jgi:hypothetical protein